MQFHPVLKYFLRLLVAGILVVTPSLASAFQMTPAVATLEPSGIKSEQIYLFTNNTPMPAAVQFSVTTREQNSDGSEARRTANGLFSVNPMQVVIPSGSTQKIRVKWLGSPNIQGEQAFRFIAQQFPVQLSKENALNVSMTMTMEAALYIRPTNAAPETQQPEPTPGESNVANPDQTQTTPEMLIVNNIKAVNTAQGKQLSITVKNPTGEHVILEKVSLHLTHDGAEPVILSGQQLGNLFRQNLLGGSTRHFVMPLPAGFAPQQTWSGSLHAQP
jgi:fimbrial chaperone protein